MDGQLADLWSKMAVNHWVLIVVNEFMVNVVNDSPIHQQLLMVKDGNG